MEALWVAQFDPFDIVNGDPEPVRQLHLRETLPP
jgi:hypothetical protein